ncbi:unnamed protein product [Mytilus edulis]|uniref:PML C-terminal domain-containing protein n=1 Tax=Mytilus edulis TaxID=6550 RepID=A0A8S3TX89_MYTED|nr:unnamed protein product [Mytilus edulis]
MLAQNQGSPEKIEKGVRGMIDHMYGKHENCDIKWCGFLKDRASYRHTNLPFGKDLKSESLKADLEKLFLGKIESQSKKLSKLASSQANESFNHTVSTKAAKNKHYSGSSSLNYRVSAAVLQKNEGYGYVSKVSEAAGLSPGNETIKRAIRLNGKRDKKSERAKTKQHKKRRINLKKERSVKSTGVEIREGRTYESEIGMDNEQLDEEIPAPMNASLCIPIDISTAPLVVFDLETTSLFDDTRALFKSLTSKALNNLDSFVFPVSHPYDCIFQQDNLKSYNEAIACKAITRATALKASKSNLKLSHLKLSIERMGLEGLKALLSEKTDRGNVRVTNCMKVIRKIFDFLTPES